MDSSPTQETKELLHKKSNYEENIEANDTEAGKI